MQSQMLHALPHAVSTRLHKVLISHVAHSLEAAGCSALPSALQVSCLPKPVPHEAEWAHSSACVHMHIRTHAQAHTEMRIALTLQVTGRTALHEAVLMNSLSMAAVLLRAGADPDVGHTTHGPPLLHAAAFGEAAMVKLLLSEVRHADGLPYLLARPMPARMMGTSPHPLLEKTAFIYRGILWQMQRLVAV